MLCPSTPTRFAAPASRRERGAGDRRRPRERPPRRARRRHASDRSLRLGCRWTHGAPRVPRDPPPRGLHLPRRPRQAALRPASPAGSESLRARDRRLPASAEGEADRRRLQHRHLGLAAGAAVGAHRPGDRRDRTRGGLRRTRDPQPPQRPAGDGGDRRRRPLPDARRRPRRRRADDRGRLPQARAADRGGEADRRGRERIRAPAQAGGLRHRDPRLHPLPADPTRLRAGLRARGHPRLLRRRDRARGG